ncbi:putative ferric reductase transmembrane component [Candida tropicalis]
MKSNYVLFVTFYLVACISAMSMAFEKYGDYMGFYTCNRQIKTSVTFCGKSSNYYCLCTNKNSLATYAGCLTHNHRNSTKQLEKLVSFCKRYGGVDVEEHWFDNAYQNFVENSKTASEISNFTKSVPLTVPFKFEDSQLDLFAKAYKQYLNNHDDSVYYGGSLLAYWLLIMILYGVVHWTKYLFPGFASKLTCTPVNIWRRYISMPATFRRKKCQEQRLLMFFDFLVPSRLETIVIALFYGLTILVNAIRTGYVENDPFLGDRYEAKLRYVADRTGIIPTVMMPLIFLFGGRNNFFQWLTGMNYNVFMTYHRHVARVMFALVVIHAACYSVIFVKVREDYSGNMKATYMIWGTIATVAGGMILFSGMLYIRRRWYEMFLFVHIVLAAIYIAGTWLHVADYGYLCFVYPAIAVWCFDRVVRIGRLISFGFPQADIELLQNNTLKIIIPKPNYWKAIPGGHGFIHFIKPSCFWQSHPFTFVESPNGQNIVLYCKVKGGVTHSLHRMLINMPGRSSKSRVTLEGPYGESTPAKYADTAVFIAGGNGIPGIYSEVTDIAKGLSSESKKVIKLIWVVKDYTSMTWFLNKLEHLNELNIQTTIYITRKKVTNFESDKKVETSTDDETESIKSILPNISFKEGRPMIGDIVSNEIHESIGSVAFVACGHPAMVDEIRYFACQNIGNPENKRVDFYEQLQVWA